MNALVQQESRSLAHTQGDGRMAVAEILSHVTRVQEVMRAVMKPDVHYGKIPGTDKPTLLKPGAELLCMTFRIGAAYAVEDLSTDLVVRYRVTCTGVHQTTGTTLGTGMGEASSGEEKYKWVKAYPEEWEATPEHLRRKKFGWDKQARKKYEVLQVRTEPANLANTILKMANKRAYLAMVLSVTAASDCFAQDLEDMEERLREHLAGNGDEPATQAEQQQAPATWPDDSFTKQLPKFKAALEKGRSLDDVIAWAETKGALTEEQKAKIRAAAPGSGEPAAGPTFATVADRIAKAADADALAMAGDLIRQVTDERQRAELQAKYDAREAELA